MEKSMKVSFLSNKKYSAAEVINLLQVDCEKIEIATYSITDIVLCPIQLALGVFMMYYYIGISFLAGVGVILISVVVNFIIGNK
jgi:ATP-binding cassette subfamily C (CFTR/MRP) protein 2